MTSSRWLFLPLVLFSSACEERGASLRNEGVAHEQLAVAAGAPTLPRVTDQAEFSGKGFALQARRQSAAQSSPAQVVPTSKAPASADAPSMVIRNGDVALQVDSIEPAIDAVRKVAASLGGYIGNVSVSAGERQFKSASLELKIPAARFDDAMMGLAPIRKLERSTSSAQDVGEEFVDITARIANAKRLEARLVNLLATRTARLQDVLSVERELARVREEIERYEGRARYLSSRAAMSTIVANVHEPLPIVASQPGTSPMREAFVNMWRNFVRFVAAAIEISGVAIPLAVLIGAAFWGWRRFRRPNVPATA